MIDWECVHYCRKLQVNNYLTIIYGSKVIFHPKYVSPKRKTQYVPFKLGRSKLNYVDLKSIQDYIW